MGGKWESQSKVLPGVYINFKNNTALSITMGERGVAVLPMKIEDGDTKGSMFKVTASESELKDGGITVPDKEMNCINEALKNASTVLVYNLGLTPSDADLDTFLGAMNTADFNTIGYIYDTSAHLTKIANWIKAAREEGKAVQAVLSGYEANTEGIINVGNGVIMNDKTQFTANECCAWVAGATAGAKMNESLTNYQYTGAVDVTPRRTKSQQEDDIKKGKFIFKANSKQRVSCVYDINSKTDDANFRKNRLLRVMDNINNDIQEIFESSFSGKMNNNEEGRGLLKAALIDYMRELERLNCIEEFDVEDVNVNAGNDKDSVVIECNIKPIDSAEKFYITVNVK